ncbi:MAG: hypothetical protein AB1342_06410 [Pseudomonadota bacterium]
MFKLKLAAAFACALAFSSLPARAADVATPDDTARFLAGMQPSADSPLAALARDPSWQRHARYMDGIFDQTEKRHLSKIRAFAKANLNKTHDTMFYMFAGPDSLHAVSFFPNATTYVMAGLEPVGNIPPLNSLPNLTLFRSLENLAYSMKTLLTLSFFRTKDMKSELRNGPVFGTTPIISVFLVRAGKTIHDISYVKIDNDGSEHPASDTSVKSNAPAVKIVFSDGKDGRKQTLYYFSTDLSDSGLKVSGFLAFCDKLGRGDSFIKSASYLMHGGNFKTIRSFLLARSDLLLQDDSGIPLGYFNRKAWQFQPLGRYLGPIEIFPGTYQPQMADLFRNVTPIPLDFGIGYRWRNNESNMLLATRTLEPGIAPEVTPSEAPPPRVQRAPAKPPVDDRPQLRRFWPF